MPPYHSSMIWAGPNVDEMLGVMRLVLACALIHKDMTYMGDNRYR